MSDRDIIYVDAWCQTAGHPSWSYIMSTLDGYHPGEVVIITGEHEDINLKFLNNMWVFARETTLYISYATPASKIEKIAELSSWQGWAIGDIDERIFIDVQKTYSIKKIDESIDKRSAGLVCIENLNFTDNFEVKIEELKKLAKKKHVPILVHINKKFVDMDTILNCSLLNKILYFTNASVYIYTLKSVDGLQVATRISPGGYCVIEDHRKPVKGIDVKKALAKFKEENAKQEFKQIQLSPLESVKEEKIEKEKKQVSEEGTVGFN